MEISEVFNVSPVTTEQANDYKNALPFPHMVFDNFFDRKLVGSLLEEFPGSGEYANFQAGYAGNFKRAFKPTIQVDSLANFFYGCMNHPDFLKYLEDLTGIKGLMPDPYYEGGGFHETLRGGKLGIHTDFRIHRKLNLHRRLNLILYLNEEWEESWGGHLELWDRQGKACVKRVLPAFNRVVIFNTDSTSYHGHPQELVCPPDKTRRSIALYYYTASESILKEIPNNNTNYISDGSISQFKNIKMRVKYFLWKLIPPLFVEWIEDFKSRGNSK